MTSLDVVEDTAIAEDIEAAGELGIQLAFEEGMARLALISEGWKKLSRVMLEQAPAAPSEASPASLPVIAEAA